MALTYRASATGGGTTGTSDRTAAITPATGDLLVVFCAAEANTNASPTCTDDNGSGTYTLLNTALFGTGILSVFIRTAKMANATATTVTVATGSNTSAEIAIIAVAGANNAGSGMVRS